MLFSISERHRNCYDSFFHPLPSQTSHKTYNLRNCYDGIRMFRPKACSPDGDSLGTIDDSPDDTRWYLIDDGNLTWSEHLMTLFMKPAKSE